tara:strand:- start:1898 stop:2725 length:828 start_codon:yes stop_codon:yes gene_type:complete
MNIFKQDILFAYLFLIANIVILYYSSFKNGVPTCNNYVINVYLYLAFFIILYYLFIRLQNKLMFKKDKQKNLLTSEETFETTKKYYSIYFFSLLFIVIILLFNPFPLFFTPSNYPSSFIYSFFTFTLLLFFISGLSIGYFKSKQYAKYISEALQIVFIIFITMSYLVYTFPLFFEKSYSYVVPGLLAALLASILFSLINLFTAKSRESFLTFAKIIAYFGIVIFSIFISYDTSRLFQNEKLCNLKRIPNYPQESYIFLLDIINIFNKILFIKGNE